MLMADYRFAPESRNSRGLWNSSLLVSRHGFSQTINFAGRFERRANEPTFAKAASYKSKTHRAFRDGRGRGIRAFLRVSELRAGVHPGVGVDVTDAP